MWTNNMFGPILIGIVIGSIFTGIAAVQIVTFARNYKNHPVGERITVWSLWVLDTLHLCSAVHMIYHYLVSNPTDMSVIWSLPVHILILVMIMPTVHWLYIFRIWKVASTRKFVPVVLGFLVSGNSAIGIYVAVKLFQTPDVTAILAVAGKEAVTLFLALSTAINFFIAASLAYALSKAGTNLRWTDSSYTMLLAYLVNTGGIASVLSLSLLVAFAVSKSFVVLVGIETVTTRSYTNSFLGMVNARHYFQASKPSTALVLRAETSSQDISSNKSQQRLSKTINEVGLPLFQSSSKSEDIKMLEVMVKHEAHTDLNKL